MRAFGRHARPPSFRNVTLAPHRRRHQRHRPGDRRQIVEAATES
ncbi:hypothetical protein [Streptomyces sp. NPDC101237]